LYFGALHKEMALQLCGRREKTYNTPIQVERRFMKTPKVGFVSLGCPKALVDSERILTQLKTEGYQVASDYDGADLVVVNTCGFIESAVQESLDAIGEAMSENGRVIVTGCLGKDEDKIRQMHPNVLKVTGAAAYQDVMEAVHEYVPAPPKHNPFIDLVPEQGVR
jgi:ribosomal protein S12 methylthiotransferase